MHISSEFLYLISIVEDPKVSGIYERAERKSALISRSFMWIQNVGSFFMTHLTSVFSLAYNIHFRDNYDPKTYFIAFKLVVPFIAIDNFLGFFIHWLINLQIGHGTLLTINSVFMFFVSCCIYLKAACDHLKQIFDEIDDLASSEPRKINQTALMKRKLRDAVDMHIKLSQ